MVWFIAPGYHSCYGHILFGIKTCTSYPFWTPGIHNKIKRFSDLLFSLETNSYNRYECLLCKATCKLPNIWRSSWIQSHLGPQTNVPCISKLNYVLTPYRPKAFIETSFILCTAPYRMTGSSNPNECFIDELVERFHE